MTAKRIILLGRVLGCLQAASSQPATLRAMKLADLVRGADVIFVGSAASSVSPLAARSYCTLSVTFTRTASGTRTGTVTITDDAAASPHVVSLTGTGISP